MPRQVFEKILIANRGEIALRIIRTLRKMGIKSVAVYSEADANSLHVQEADEAYFIGNSPAPESYLNINNIIAAIEESGASAVHPGYGFLSENAHFARLLEKKRIELIGPSSHAIAVMGDKIEAKKMATKAGVQTVPGYVGEISDVNQAISIATEIGFPVIVKAAAGGGGRGMRVVKKPDQMHAAFTSARFEAQNCFSDNRVFIEKLIQKPRHIEIQILADKFGNIVCLGERDCSIQRQHQKVIEEAPSSFISDSTRKAMYEQSIALSKQVNYHSAGTVEFIVDKDQNFYFVEMNTRLQVEHCVTELVTGFDIVEEMVKIAANKKLSFTQDDVKINGHAIECRIYAEDPLRGFLPSSGRITEYVEPPKNPHIRLDSGVRAGADVSMFYDAMIAKLCTHDSSRILAIKRMREALGAFLINGIGHNMSFLEAVMSNKKFESDEISTDFISSEYPDGFVGAELTSEVTENFLAVAMHVFYEEQKRSSSILTQIDNQSRKLGTRWIVTLDNNSYYVIIKPVDRGLNVRQGTTRINIRSDWHVGSKIFSGHVSGRFVNFKIDRVKTGYKLTHAGIEMTCFVRSARISELESLMPKSSSSDSMKELKAPLTGQIIALKVLEGQKVKIGDELLILTAMKMENVISSPVEAVVKKIYVSNGENVSSNQILIEFE